MIDNKYAYLESHRPQILLRALDERYKSMHVTRERAQSMAIWSLGALLAASGWIIRKETPLTVDTKIAGTLLIVVTFYVVKEFYLKGLDKTFQDQHRVAVKIEKALGLYEKEIFCEDAIYPEHWSKDASEKKKRYFFLATYRLLYLGAFMFLAILWFA